MPAALGLAAKRLDVAAAIELWKRAESSGRAPDAARLAQRGDRLAGVEQQRGPRAPPRRAAAGRPPARRGRRRLELRRRLALVVDRGAQPADRGHRVEEAAHARRQGRGDAGAHQLADLVPARRVHRPLQRGRERRALARRLDEPGARHPPRLPDRRAPRQAHRPQQPRPLVAGEAAGEKLAAPDRPVGPVARAVVDRAQRGPARRARRGRRPGARDGAGRPTARPPRARARTSSRGTPGGGRGRRRRVDREEALEVLDAHRERGAASRSSRGRRCGGRPRRASPWRGRRCS